MLSVLRYGDAARDLPTWPSEEQAGLQSAACPALGRGGQEGGGTEAEEDGLLQATGASAREPRERRRASEVPEIDCGDFGQSWGAEFEFGLNFFCNPVPDAVHGVPVQWPAQEDRHAGQADGGDGH